MATTQHSFDLKSEDFSSAKGRGIIRVNNFVDQCPTDKGRSYLVLSRPEESKKYADFLRECKESSVLGKSLGLLVQNYTEGTVDNDPSVCIDEPVAGIDKGIFAFDSGWAPTDPVRKAWAEQKGSLFRRNAYYITMKEWESKLKPVIQQIEGMRAAKVVFGLFDVKIAFLLDSQNNSSVSIYRPFLSALIPITKDCNSEYYYSRVMRNVIEQTVWEELCLNEFGMPNNVRNIFTNLVIHYNEKYGFEMELPYPKTK